MTELVSFSDQQSRGHMYTQKTYSLVPRLPSHVRLFPHVGGEPGNEATEN